MSEDHQTPKSEKPEEPASITDVFYTKFNQNGYGLPQAVAREVNAAFRAGESRWVLEAAEFPVDLNGESTRIDLLLRGGSTWDRKRRSFLVIECKRVNPAYSAWCFAQLPYVRRNASSPEVLVERVERAHDESIPMNTPEQDDVFIARGHGLIRASKPYQLGLVLPTQQKRGDSGGDGHARDALEKIAGQVLRGLSGLVDSMVLRSATLAGLDLIDYLPVVVTTANLWTTDADLGSTDLLSGKLAPSAGSLVQTDYVEYQYTASPSLRPVRTGRKPEAELSQLLDQEFTRTIHVVSAAGLRRFLLHASAICDLL